MKNAITDGYILLLEGGKARLAAEGLCFTNEVRIDRARRTAVRGSAPSIDGAPNGDADAETATLHERIAAPGPFAAPSEPMLTVSR